MGRESGISLPLPSSRQTMIQGAEEGLGRFEIQTIKGLLFFDLNKVLYLSAYYPGPGSVAYVYYFTCMVLRCARTSKLSNFLHSSRSFLKQTG